MGERAASHDGQNSPARATDAHISIIGHSTRDELRGLLAQTESANGFGNRFNWLAVRRSKCLPEGGKIETVNFNDLVTRLHSAIEFARGMEEMKRSEEARELWRAAYPELSEGKPGMLGAVTGRAEAQVMRLSTLYAVLDKSAVIGPEHHHAAMALWRYCEQSAQWIFGTSTGDRNADKILRALRHAQAGMTKTEISVEVFNRHASSAEIDEALAVDPPGEERPAGCDSRDDVEAICISFTHLRACPDSPRTFVRLEC
jgi:hypothetical protein